MTLRASLSFTFSRGALSRFPCADLSASFSLPPWRTSTVASRPCCACSSVVPSRLASRDACAGRGEIDSQSCCRDPAPLVHAAISDPSAGAFCCGSSYQQDSQFSTLRAGRCESPARDSVPIAAATVPAAASASSDSRPLVVGVPQGAWTEETSWRQPHQTALILLARCLGAPLPSRAHAPHHRKAGGRNPARIDLGKTLPAYFQCDGLLGAAIASWIHSTHLWQLPCPASSPPSLSMSLSCSSRAYCCHC